ncbi:hypothetical protein [Hymenobacter persicinus]|uniref:Uncharacterized protein n=1 Tax=Hymenobacter persicinus TaxID=2025506 RepID=A0A4Q5L9B2_9BACT|nr:hypothetical protein [Hymenobacter persicinus]RYU76700.1 hypothetical protein EWM57_18335 [Hymenobacter persicinus]
MDLHDFRRQWQQQPTPAGCAADEAALRALLTESPTSPVTRMLRNARHEIIWTIITVGLTLAGLLFVGLPWIRPLGVLLLTSAVLMGYYYYHKLRALSRLGTTDGPLRGQVARQLRTLRRLLRLYYRLTMATLVVMGSFLLFSAYTHLPHLFRGDARTLWQQSLWLALTALVTGLLVHWLTRYHLQHQYGRHLDRLEGVLRELEETQ